MGDRSLKFVFAIVGFVLPGICASFERSGEYVVFGYSIKPLGGRIDVKSVMPALKHAVVNGMHHAHHHSHNDTFGEPRSHKLEDHEVKRCVFFSGHIKGSGGELDVTFDHTCPYMSAIMNNSTFLQQKEVVFDPKAVVAYLKERSNRTSSPLDWESATWYANAHEFESTSEQCAAKGHFNGSEYNSSGPPVTTNPPPGAPPPPPGAPPTTTTTTEDECHPDSSTLQLYDGSLIKIKDVAPGDLIRTPKGYETVIGIPHRTATEPRPYLEISAGNFSTRLSAHHYIFVSGKEKRADAVEVGDVLTTTDGERIVDGVDLILDSGLNLILTWSGSYFVDGVMASTNTDVGSPVWFSNFMRYVFGIQYFILGVPYSPVSETVLESAHRFEHWARERLVDAGAPGSFRHVLRFLVANYIALYEPFHRLFLYPFQMIMVLAICVCGWRTAKTVRL